MPPLIPLLIQSLSLTLAGASAGSSWIGVPFVMHMTVVHGARAFSLNNTDRMACLGTHCVVLCRGTSRPRISPRAGTLYGYRSMPYWRRHHRGLRRYCCVSGGRRPSACRFMREIAHRQKQGCCHRAFAVGNAARRSLDLRQRHRRDINRRVRHPPPARPTQRLPSPGCSQCYPCKARPAVDKFTICSHERTITAGGKRCCHCNALGPRCHAIP